ncbi:MAG: T9SS type B sorting domain-containing protein [Bacteroidota bacterium]
MRKGIFILILLLQSFVVKAQNLVTNEGFEALVSVISTQGQFMAAFPWQLPGASTVSPDIFTTAYVNPPATPCDDMNVPLNITGNAIPHGGSVYAGISVDPVNGYYEYITIQLTVPLDPGDIYILDFWAMLADNSRYKLNRLGALLTTGLPVQGGTGVIPFTPQFENPAVISDSLNWTHVQFSPYLAAGGEKFLTIGFFRTNGDPQFTVTDIGSKNTTCTSLDNGAYYLIDDVSLIPNAPLFYVTADTVCVCPYNYTGVLEAIANVGVIWTNSAGDTVGTGNTLQIPEKPAIVFTPGQTYTYYAYGNGTFDSVLVKIVDIPVVNIGIDTSFCEGDSILLNAFAADAILYTWSTGDTTSFIYAKDTGDYWVVVDNCGCPAFDTVGFHTLLPNFPISIGEDSLFCLFNFDSLHLYAAGDDAISYLWSPTGETTPGITVKYEAYYNVVASKENGCKRQAGFEVVELCPPTFFIPNAFTPDDDGVNDIYFVPVTSYNTFTLRIFDRFGRLLFRSDDPFVGWDGTYKGKECPIGVYTYKLNINGYTVEGEKDPRKYLGTFTLYR